MAPSSIDARRQQARPNEAVDFESALTSTPDMSLHRHKRRKGPGADIEPEVQNAQEAAN
jgi:hypothetical protein